MEILSLISLVFGIIMLVTFFNMAGRLKDIRDSVKEVPRDREDHARAQYYVHLVNGNREAARDALLYVIMANCTRPGVGESERQRLYNEYEEKYGALFATLGYPYPPTPFA